MDDAVRKIDCAQPEGQKQVRHVDGHRDFPSLGDRQDGAGRSDRGVT